MNGVIHELERIEELTRHLPRSPLQVNAIHESDAEIIRTGAGGCSLAVTTDTIAEELTAGLYDPFLAGWMTVMASLSDLAAVGAEPIGLLVSELLPAAWGDDFRRDLQAGIAAACRTCNTYILGGDTGTFPLPALTATALGLIPAGGGFMRTGCLPGHMLYSSGPLGRGNAFALAYLRPPEEGSPLCFRPVAAIRASRDLRALASACMDTSDGVLAAADQLARLNDLGFDLLFWEEALDRRSTEIAVRCAVPSWLLMAGGHGEYQLLFTIPPEREADLRARSRMSGWHPRPLGFATRKPGVRLALGGRSVELDTARIRNIASDGTDAAEACAALCAYAHEVTS